MSIFDQADAAPVWIRVTYDEVMEEHTNFGHAIYDGLIGCRQCGHDTGILRLYLIRRGSRQLRWVCEQCGDGFTFGSLPHAFLLRYSVNIDDLPLWRDNRGLEPTRPPCVVCGDESDEDHHWAPQSIFEDWPYDLTAPLCSLHHKEWHRMMRQHGLRWPHELDIR